MAPFSSKKSKQTLFLLHWLSQMFCNILLKWERDFGIPRCFYWDHKGNEKRYTLRWRTSLMFSECVFVSIDHFTASESTIFILPEIECLSAFLLPERNFLNHMVRVIISTVSLPFIQQKIAATEKVWPSCKPWITGFQFRLQIIFVCATFKSHPE